MKTVRLSIFVLLALSFAAPSSAGGKLFMWEASKGGAVVYLLGSIHMADSSFYPMDRAIMDAFKKSSALVVEADITNSQNMMASQGDIMEKGVYLDGDSLKNHLSREAYGKVSNYFNSTGMGMEIANVLRPWAVYLMIEQIEMQKLGLDPELGIDLHFLKKAGIQGKDIEELESVSFQIELISSFSDKLQEGLILSTLNEMASMRDSVRTIIQCWKTGNSDLMETVLFSGLRKNPGLAPIYEKMFFDRNEGMADKIDGMASPGRSLFVVVGAGHLLGDGGVVSLMEDKGYDISQFASRN